MKLLLKRLYKTDKSTIGELSIDGKFECYTLEDVERKEKIFGKTAIPKGTYQVVMTMSNRFKKMMPLLLNVEGFTGVRIHSGNVSQNTEGCLLLGTTRGQDFIGGSRDAIAKFYPKLEQALKVGKVTITIE
jgi:hypothetical protein